MSDTNVTMEGNLTRDPELRFTNSGLAVASLGIAVNNRKQVNGKWEDGDPQFFNITAFGQLGENVAESFKKGSRVLVAGRLNYRSWETEGGDKRSAVEVIADAVGISLKWATVDPANVVRTTAKSNGAAQEAAAPDYEEV